MAPENTMPSLELAMDDLAFVETDVQLSRDGVPMLFHDTRSSASSGAQPPSDVATSTSSELERPGRSARGTGGSTRGADAHARRVPRRARRARDAPAPSSELKADWRPEPGAARWF
jgi:glycerophosphoryl diester phosphodiesterase